MVPTSVEEGGFVPGRGPQRSSRPWSKNRFVVRATKTCTCTMQGRPIGRFSSSFQKMFRKVLRGEYVYEYHGSASHCQAWQKIIHRMALLKV